MHACMFMSPNVDYMCLASAYCSLSLSKFVAMPQVRKRPAAVKRPAACSKSLEPAGVKPATRCATAQTAAFSGAGDKEVVAGAVTKKPAAAVEEDLLSVTKKPAAAVEEASSSFDEAEALHCPLDLPPSSPSDMDIINSETFQAFASFDPYCGALPSAASTELT